MRVPVRGLVAIFDLTASLSVPWPSRGQDGLSEGFKLRRYPGSRVPTRTCHILLVEMRGKKLKRLRGSRVVDSATPGAGGIPPGAAARGGAKKSRAIIQILRCGTCPVAVIHRTHPFGCRVNCIFCIVCVVYFEKTELAGGRGGKLFLERDQRSWGLRARFKVLILLELALSSCAVARSTRQRPTKHSYRNSSRTNIFPASNFQVSLLESRRATDIELRARKVSFSQIENRPSHTHASS